MKAVGAAALVVAWATAAVVVVGQPTAASAMSEQLPPGPGSTVTSTSAPTTASTSTPTSTKTPAATCPATSRRFPPRWVRIPGITKHAAAIPRPRVNGVPGAPPLTSAGKWQFAWDKRWPIRPGDPHGNVIMNAHVWPDGSAIGNVMLAKLGVGDRIVVHGKVRKLCYRVVKKIQVSPREALKRYYRIDGKPRLAIVVCSGRRLAPGVWEKRTIWFAAPRA